MRISLFFFTLLGSATAATAATVTDTDSLLAAVNQGEEGATIELAAGTYALPEALRLKAGMTLKGAGKEKSIITNAASWKGNPKTLPDPETNFKRFDKSGYLVLLDEKAAGITISDVTFTGPEMHGAIYGWGNTELHLHDIIFDDFMYTGYRSYTAKGVKIHDCTFLDTGQRWQKGQPGVKGGITGGGIFAVWLKDAEIYNNRFLRTKTEPNLHFYGIKAKQGKRVKIHHNTIKTNFSIEFAHENDEDVEIHHNILQGTVSIPKHAGGSVPESGTSFHIHHNYFTTSYAIEFPRNGAEISHNLFDFTVEDDGGNLISGFGGVASAGPAIFHNNLVNNPGRGVIWVERAYDGMTVRNNHIVVRTTPTPRKEGLFAFSSKSDFSTHLFANNIVECIGQPRPLFRNDASGSMQVVNNRLENVSDLQRYENPQTGEKQGLEASLKFACGVDGEMKVDGWETTKP